MAGGDEDNKLTGNFSGFWTKRILLLEKKVDKWEEVLRSKEEQRQDREFQRELKSRLRNLEERENTDLRK